MTPLRSVRSVAIWMFAATRLALAAPQAPSSAPTDGVRATLTWKATKEEGVYGYLVYRATDREGPYRRLGRDIVHVSQEPGEIHAYRFEDATVEAGRTYYYYLDKISTTGEKSRFSGVVTKVVPAN